MSVVAPGQSMMLPLPHACVHLDGHAAWRHEAAVRRARSSCDHGPALADISQYGALTESRQQALVVRGMKCIGQSTPQYFSAALCAAEK